MFSLISKIQSFFGRLAQLLLPVKKSAGGMKGSAALRWTLHIILLLLILVGLYFLSSALELHRLIRTSSVLLRRIWLPLLFLLLYILGWIGLWVWRLLAAEEEGPDFPDIDEAWSEASAALNQAGISFQDVPVFLVLGRTEAPEESLFQASRIDLVVKQTPARAALIHVYANREAIFVTCPGASLLGKHAANLALEGLEEWDPHETGEEAENPEVAMGTLVPGAEEAQTIRPGGKSGAVGGARPNSSLERRTRRRMVRRFIPDIRRKPEEVQNLTERLEHLCRLIVRDREPYCPVNGILLLVSLGATDDQLEADQTGDLCQQDLATVNKIFKLRCPLFALICDLETSWGFHEFIKQHKPERRLQRVGQRFPLDTTLSPDLRGEQVESSLEWLCTKGLRELVYHLLQVESEEGELDQITTSNTRLYQFMDLMNKRQKHLSLILRKAYHPAGVEEPFFYGGCYLAGTGKDKNQEQAFVRGVLDRLNDSQASVSWTRKAVSEDISSHRQATIGFAIIGGFWILVVLYLLKVFYFG